MKRKYILQLFLACLSVLLPLSPPLAASVDNELYFQHDGQKRSYYLHAPPSLPDGAPLVFVLHGMGGTAGKTRYGLGLNTIADEFGFAVVYPQGSRFADGSTYWNAGYAYSKADDLGFLETLAKHLQQHYKFDPQRTYVLGISNGGFMTYTLACRGTHVFHAIASVIGTMVQSDWENCTPKGNTSVLHMHGVQDKTVHFKGGVHWHSAIGRFPSAHQVVDYWVQAMGMHPRPIQQDTPNVSFAKYSATDGSAKLLYVQMDSFGHDWPHKQNAGFSAAHIIMEFFADLAKNQPRSSAQ